MDKSQLLIRLHQECELLYQKLTQYGQNLQAPLDLGIVVNELRKAIESKTKSLIPVIESDNPPEFRELENNLSERLNSLARTASRTLDLFDQYFEGSRLPLSITEQLARVSDAVIDIENEE